MISLNLEIEINFDQTDELVDSLYEARPKWIAADLKQLKQFLLVHANAFIFFNLCTSISFVVKTYFSTSIMTFWTDVLKLADVVTIRT